MKKKILLIEDVQEFRQLMQLFLSQKFEVVTAENGKDAIEKIKNNEQASLDNKKLVEKDKGKKVDIVDGDFIQKLFEDKKFDIYRLKTNNSR